MIRQLIEQLAGIPTMDALEADAREFRAIRWWTVDELATAAPEGFEPHLGRALGALRL